MALYTIEKKVAGVWTRWRDAKDRDDAQKGVESARRCNPDEEWQVGEYVRADQVRWLVEYEARQTNIAGVPPGPWQDAGYRRTSIDDAIDLARRSQAQYPAFAYRVVCERSSVEVVETFPPRTP